MIKLKNLIKEIAFPTDDIDDDASYKRPREVIDVVREIAIVVAANKKSITDWVVVTGPTPDSDSDEKDEVVWNIDKPVEWDENQYWYIGYYVKRNKWKIFYTQNRRVVREVWIDKEKDLKNCIDNWTK